MAKFLQAVDWADPVQVKEAHSLLGDWRLSPMAALELLDSQVRCLSPQFADPAVRRRAVDALRQLSDADLEKYLLQLCQVLKYEPYHDSPLAQFLTERALANRHRIGHIFFWYLRAEIHTAEIQARFSYILEG